MKLRGKSDFSPHVVCARALVRCFIFICSWYIEIIMKLYQPSKRVFLSNTYESLGMIHKQMPRSWASLARSLHAIGSKTSMILFRCISFFLFCQRAFVASISPTKTSPVRCSDYIRKKKLIFTRWIAVWWSSVEHLVQVTASSMWSDIIGDNRMKKKEDRKWELHCSMSFNA